MPKGFKHGLRYTPEYIVWRNMKDRCLNPNRKDFKNYGERGVSVCQEWTNNFEAFYQDMGPRPSKNHSIDRIDVNGNYCKENCRWITIKEQQNNKRNNRLITIDGETKTLIEWSQISKIPYRTIISRLESGWPENECLKTTTGTSKMLTHNGKTQNIKQWAEELGINRNTISIRIKNGMSIEDVLK